MIPEELEIILRKKEGLKLEFKREYKLDIPPPAGTEEQLWTRFLAGQWDEFIKDILALANGNVGTATQAGILVVGADNDLPPDGPRQTYDTSYLGLTEKQILEKVNSACDPPIPDIHCERIELEGKILHIITIPPSPHVHETTRVLRPVKEPAFDNTGRLRNFKDDKAVGTCTVFIRRNESVHPAKASERQALEKDKQSILYSSTTHKDQAPLIPLQRPRRTTHFTGRETELARLMADLQPGCVVTLCGPGGVGKTTLIAEVTWRLAPGDTPPNRFPGGIIFHTFYHQPQADLALEAIARAYGEDPRPSPAAAAQRALANRRALIVLDGAEAANNLQPILDITGDCGVLITTRRHSDAPEAWQDIKPLPAGQSIQLLQAWGGDRASDENVVRRICELLGGLPLAIYLVGRYLAQRQQEAVDYLAWLEQTPLAALDFGQRQRESIPLLLERSLAHLSEIASCTLAVVGRLGQSPFDRQVIIIALDSEVTEVNHCLGELIDYGLLLRANDRYQISHALAHTYARSIPVPSDALDRLVAHYIALAEEQSTLGPPGFVTLDLEHTHILAIQSACLAAEHWDAVQDLAWAIKSYLNLQGHAAEQIATFQMGLQAAIAAGDRYNESAFLSSLGNAYFYLGDVQKAIEFFEQALAIACKTGDRGDEGHAFQNLGAAYARLGHTQKAIEFFEQALAIARETSDRAGEGNALNNLGTALRHSAEGRGDVDNVHKAIEFYEQALAIAREVRTVRSKQCRWHWGRAEKKRLHKPELLQLNVHSGAIDRTQIYS